MKPLLRRFIQVISQLLIIIIILFISAGTIRWLWAWVYLGIGIFILAANALVLDAELVAERGKKKEGVKKFDKIITTINIIPAIAIMVLSGVEYRFG